MLNKFDKEFYKKLGTVLTVLIVTTAVIWGAWRTAADETVPLENADQVYTQAVSQLSRQKNVYYKVTGTKTMSFSGITTEESFTQLVTYEEQGTANFRGCVEEDLQIGSQSIKSFEFFSDGAAYFTVQGASFQSPMTAENYAARYAPAALIDPALYAEITGVTNTKGSTISFAMPGATEQWTGGAAGKLETAAATATINADGALTTSSYTVKYTLQDVKFTLQISVHIIYGKTQPIQLPDSSAYTPISDIDVPKMLERSCGYLTSAQSIHSVYEDYIFCEAFGDERTQSVKLSTDDADNWSANVDTTVALSNSSKAGSVTTFTKNESFKHDTYTYSTDGSPYTSDSSVDKLTMHSYCENLLLGTILLPGDIKTTQISETDGVLQIQFGPNNDFAEILAQDACLTLYQNATILIEQALSYKTDTVTSYLFIDKLTGFPISSGFFYSGAYEIGGIPYQLTFKADQAYFLTLDDAQEQETEQADQTNAQEAEVS